jgi:RNA polymerase primary sigma factor
MERQSIYKELLEGNLRFVITVAKQYQNQGMELGDLIAEGNFGLMKAIKNFDWTKKLRFISYAVWWIKQSIIQSLNENSRTIRLPVNVVQDLQKAKKESQKNNTELDSRFTSLPKVIDLDMNINEEGDTLVDLIENTNAVQPDESFNTAEILKEKLRGIMSILDERERLIVEDYFGLSGTPRTLEDIGQDFKLTKERVRQIKEKALRKLRNESSVLFEYL